MHSPEQLLPALESYEKALANMVKVTQGLIAFCEAQAKAYGGGGVRVKPRQDGDGLEPGGGGLGNPPDENPA